MLEACLHTRGSRSSTSTPAIWNPILTLALLNLPVDAVIVHLQGVNLLQFSWSSFALTPSSPGLVQVAVLRSSGQYTVGRFLGGSPGWVRVEVHPSGALDVQEGEALRLLGNLQLI